MIGKEHRNFGFGGNSSTANDGQQYTPPTIISATLSENAQRPGDILRVEVVFTEGNPAATPTFQWTRNGVAISGETSETYTLDIGDDNSEIRCAVSISNIAGSVVEVTEAFTVQFPPPNPEEIGAIYWWSADEGFEINGTSVSWVDRVQGAVVNNVQHSNGVSFGVPKKIVTEDHDYRPAMFARGSGALHGALTPMAQARQLTLFVVARAGNAEYTRMFAAVSADLSHSTGRWSVNARDSSVYGANAYQNFTGGPPATNENTVLYEWSMGPNRTLGELTAFADETQLTLGIGTGATRVMDSNFPRVVIGARPNSASALIFTNSEIEHVIVMDRVDATKRQQIRDWWNWKKAQIGSIENQISVVLQYGQSNAVGQEATAETVYGIHGNLCFGNYLLSWYGEQVGSPPDRLTVQTLKERVYETGMTIGLDSLVERYLARDQVSDWRELENRYFALNPAVSGRSIEQLASGSDWSRLVSDIVASKSHFEDGGFDWVWWTHGYSNASDARGAYYPKLVSMFNNIRNAAIAAGYDGADPNYIIAQHCTSRTNATFPSVGLSQLQLARESYKVSIFPLYPMNWKNGIHMSTLGQKLKGEYYSKVMYDIDNGGYNHVEFSLVSWSSVEIVIRVSGGNGSYVFDTTTLPAASNMGFDVWAANSTTLQNIISSVTMVGDLITLSLSSPASAGSRLGYGWGRAGMGQPSNAPYPLGNLRDTDPRVKVMSGVTYGLFNWCVISEVDMP